MANDLKRVGLVFNADGSTDFVKSLRLVNSTLQENYQDFKLVQAQWDKSTTTSQKLTDKLNYLNNAYDIQKDKVTLLKKELEELEDAEEKDEVAIQKKKAALASAEASLQKYQNQIEETSKKIKIGTANLEDFAKKLDSTGDKLVSAGKDMSKVSAGIVAIGTAGVMAGANFEEAMSEVQAISGASGEELLKLKDKAEQMGATTKFSATESANAMYYMALAGWKTEDMLNGIEGVMNLAAASGEDLAMVSDIVTDGLTAMGYAASDSAKFADVFAKTVTNSNTDVEGLGEAMKYTGSIAGALNLELEDVSLALGLMANSGVKASQAGTSLRAILQRLSTNTGGARDSIEELGIEVFDSEGKMRDFGEIIADMRDKFANLSDEEKTTIAKTVAGTTAMSGFLAIVNSGEEDFNKLSSAINNSNGAAKEMANTMIDNLKGDFTLIKSQLEGLGIQLSEILIPILRDILSHVSNFLTWLSKLNPQIKVIIVAIAGLVAAIGPLLIIFGSLAKSISNIIFLYTTYIAPMLAGMSTAISSIIAPILAIIAVIALVVLAIKQLWDTNEEFRNNITNAMNGFIETLQNFWTNIVEPILNIIKDTISTIWTDSLKPLWDNFVIFVGEIINEFLNFWNYCKPIIDKIIELLGPVITVVITELGVVFSKTFASITKILITAMNFIKDFVSGIIVIFRGIIDFIVGIFTLDWKKAWEGVKTIFSGIFQSLGSIVKAPLNLIISAINGLISGLNVFIKSLNRIKIPSWVPGVGGKGLSIPTIGTISYLAKGGELLNGTAMIAEAGPELLMQQGNKTKVLPLTNGGGVTPTQLIDYNKLANTIVKSLNSCKFTLDEDGFVGIVKDELLKVM